MLITRHYFAYGSNMDSAQMALRCPDSTKIANATLEGYFFAINERGVATAIPQRGTNTDGVLWSISSKDKLELDRYEGVSQDFYYCEETRVTTNAGSVMAMIYIATSQSPGSARPGYVEKIIRAAREEHGIAEVYIQTLEKYLPVSISQS